MKYLLYIFLFFIAFLVFAPEAGSHEIRNPELLIAIAAVAVLVPIIRLCKLAKLAGDLKKSAEGQQIRS